MAEPKEQLPEERKYVLSDHESEDKGDDEDMDELYDDQEHVELD